MSSFLKSALQLHKTQRPVLPVDGDIPRVPEEPWATTGPWQEAQHRTHTTATAPAARLRAGRETHEDFPGFAAAHQTSKALAEHQSHLQLHRAVWKEMCVSGRGREGESGGTCFYGLWKLVKPLVEFWGKVLRLAALVQPTGSWVQGLPPLALLQLFLLVGAMLYCPQCPPKQMGGSYQSL